LFDGHGLFDPGMLQFRIRAQPAFRIRPGVCNDAFHTVGTDERARRQMRMAFFELDVGHYHHSRSARAISAVLFVTHVAETLRFARQCESSSFIKPLGHRRLVSERFIVSYPKSDDCIARFDNCLPVISLLLLTDLFAGNEIGIAL
jgi:hypothetical protein